MRLVTSWRFGFIVGWGLSATCLALPLTVPDTVDQQWRRQQQQDRALQEQLMTPEKHLPLDTRPAPIPPYPMDDMPCDDITRIRLVGEASERFSFALATVTTGAFSAIGRCLGATGRVIVAQHVNNALLKRGYVTTRVSVASLPVAEGELTLIVHPGRLGQIRFEDGVERHRAVWAAFPLSSGDILNLRAIEQALENMSRLPHADFQVHITPTDNPSVSDLVVRYQQGRPWLLSVVTDNAGSRTTGRYQGHVTGFLGNVFGVYDVWYLSTSRSLADAAGPGHPEMSSVNMQVSFPIGYTLIDVAMSQSHSDQYFLDNATRYIYRYRTQNRSQQLGITHTLYRDAVRKTALLGRLLLHQANGWIADQELEIQRRRTTQWELGVNHREYWGQAVLDATVACRWGSRAFEALPAPELPSPPETSVPLMGHWEAQLTRPLAVFTRPGVYQATWRGQWAWQPLAAADRLALGSRYTVRGFDENTQLAGDNGMILRQEWSTPLGTPSLLGVVAYDIGTVGKRPHPHAGGSTLSGMALGLRGALGASLSYELFAAWGLVSPAGIHSGHPTVMAKVSGLW